MRLKKIIDTICTPVLSKYGFKFLGARDKVLWVYQKVEGNVTQEVQIKKLTWGKSLSLNIKILNARDRFSVGEYLSDLIKENSTYLWDYESKEDVEDILKKHMEVFEKNGGMKLIESMSIPVVIPTDEMIKILMNNTVEKAKEFSQKYNLSFEMDINNVKKLEEILLKKRELTNIAIDQDFLISAGAYYGELLIHSFSGKWKYEKDSDNNIEFFINKVGYKPDDSTNRQCCVLTKVFFFYTNPYYSRHSLVRLFKSYVKDKEREYFPLIEEEFDFSKLGNKKTYYICPDNIGRFAIYIRISDDIADLYNEDKDMDVYSYYFSDCIKIKISVEKDIILEKILIEDDLYLKGYYTFDGPRRSIGVILNKFYLENYHLGKRANIELEMVNINDNLTKYINEKTLIIRAISDD